MKALGIATAADLAALADYAPAVDRFLLDAKPPPDAALPGGNAAAFDWSLLAGQVISRPWLLAGGLTPDNVAAAIRATGAPGVDVSSGVERARGVKDPARIAAFIAAARG
jgi:phosphoribosylanthranilate isomerase